MTTIYRLPFSAEMTKQWRNNNKTQTRRVIPIADPASYVLLNVDYQNQDGQHTNFAHAHFCKRGHQTRVAYKFRYGGCKSLVRIAEPLIRSDDGYTHYRADNYPVLIDGQRLPWKWKVKALAARYCPNSCIRSHAQIKNVFVQQVQSMRNSDAHDEGTPAVSMYTEGTAKAQFSRLWDKINAGRGYGWDLNPWVFGMLITSRLESERMRLNKLAKEAA